MSVRAPAPLLLFGVFSALLLNACVSPPAPPPTVSLEGRSCANRPDLTSALPVALGGDPVKVTLDGAAACWQPDGGASSAYVVFQLPISAEPYLASVKSAPIGQGLFSPRVLILDEEGNVLRELSRDAFLFHGAALQAGLRVRPGERFLVVASDSGSVGQQVSQIADGINTTTIVAGRFASAYHTGAEATRTMTYAHNGLVTVSAEPMPQVR